MRRGGDIFSVYLSLVHAWMLERSIYALCFWGRGRVLLTLRIILTGLSPSLPAPVTAAPVARDTVGGTIH
jgi:hypothetical protein